jgi:parallel beta-helix repeat protein
VISPSATNNKPSLAFTVAPVFCCNPRSRVFEAKLQDSLGSAGVVFRWEFGDGRAGQGSTIEHAYTWPGKYVITLQAEFSDGTVMFSEQELLLPGDPMPPDDNQPNEVPDPVEPTNPDDPNVTDPEPPSTEGTDEEVPPDTSGMNPDAIAQVLAGILPTANASWWGFDAKDATHAIQGAINSGAKTVIIPNVGKDWNVGPLFLVSDQEVIFEAGVVVAAKSGAFRGMHDCLLSADGVTNVALRGYNAVLRMRKSDYISSSYSVSEWRHVLFMRGVNNMQVLGLSLQSSGGDGIYVGPTEDSQRVASRNVILRDCECFENHRQGISVWSAENLTIDNCTLRGTSGTAPQAGIDLEPNHPKDVLINVQLINCKAIGNAGSGFIASLGLMTPTSRPVSISVVNMLIQGSHQPGLRVLIAKDGPPGGFLEFRDCIVEGTEYAGLATKLHLNAAVEVRFDHCEWRKVARFFPQPPIYMEFVGSGTSEAPGGIRFTDCLVNDQQARDTIRVVDDSW